MMRKHICSLMLLWLLLPIHDENYIVVHASFATFHCVGERWMKPDSKILSCVIAPVLHVGIQPNDIADTKNAIKNQT